MDNAPPEAARESRLLDSVDSWTGASARRVDLATFYQREAVALSEQRPERAALMWLEAAKAQHRDGADDEPIERSVDAALRLRPNAAWVLGQARRLLHGRGRYAQAVQLAEREVQAGGDGGLRAAVLFEASSISLQQLQNPSEALRLAEQALRVQPHHMPSLVRVAALREQLSQHTEAARALQQLSEYLTSPAQRAQLLYATGTILELQLGQDEAAQAAYLRALESDPAYVPALASLCELQERTEQWSDLCRSLERLAEINQAGSLRARLLRRAGRLHFDRTGNLEAACRDLTAAATAARDDTSILQHLAHAWEARGRPKEAVQTLDQLLELTLDRQGRAALMTRIGVLQLEQLNDPERAITAFTGALDEAPGYLPALQSLGTLYRRRGDFASLVAMSNPETEGMLPPQQRALRHLELAELLHERLEAPDRAIAAYRRALELSPGNLLAFWQLGLLLGRLGRHAEMADLLAAQAEASADPRTRAHLLLRRAQLQAGPLGDPDAAISTLRRARPDDGARSVALDQIDLHARTGRHAVLVELLLVQAAVTEDPHEAEGRRLLAARVLELALDEGDKALQLYREVLVDNPASAAAVHGAGRILHRRGAWSELVELHYFELEQQPDRVDAPTLLCRVGRILAEKLGHQDAAVDTYARALKRDPSCTPALAALEQLARGREQWAQLVSVLERRAGGSSHARAAALSLRRAAEVAGWQLGDWSEAARLYREAMAAASGASVGEHGLLRVLLHQRQWPEAAALLEQLIESGEAAEGRSLAQLSLSRLREFRLRQPPDLEGYAQAATGLLAGALDQQLLRVRRLCQATDLVDALVAQSADCGDELLGCAYLLEAAHLSELQRPADWARVAEASRAARERAPDDLNAIWSLERAMEASGDWEEVGQLRAREAALELDQTLRAQHLAGAAAALLQAGQIENAARLGQQSVDADPGCLPALQLLAQVAETRRDWHAAAQAHDQLAAVCAAQDNRRHHALGAAELWAALVRDRGRALASIEVALSDDPSNDEAFSLAVRLLQCEEDLEQLSSMHQRAIESCEEPRRKVELLRQNARLLGQLGSDGGRPGTDRAIAALNALLAIRPADVDALAELAELQSREQQWSDAAATLERLVESATDEQTRHTARVQQAELWLDQLDEPDRAHKVLELAASERPSDLGVARLRLRQMRAVGSWSAARALLEQVAQDEQRSVRLWAQLQLAEIAALALNDSELRRSCEREAVQLAASEADIVGQLRQLGLDQAQIQRLLELAEASLEGASAAEATRMRRFIAAVATEELGDPMRALPHLKRLLADTPHDANATLLMARALEAKDEPAAAVQHYRQLLEHDPGALQGYRGLTRTAGPEVALSAAAIVELLGASEAAEQRLLNDIRWDELPNGSLSAAPPHPEERFSALQQLLEALLPYLDSAYPTRPGEVPSPDHPVLEPVRQLTHTLGLGTIEIRLGETGSARVGIGRPATLLIDTALAQQPPGPEFRFWIGRALGRALAGGAIVQQLDEDEFAQLFAALRERKAAAPTATELQRTLQRAVPRKVRRHIARLLPKAHDPKVWARYRRRLERWADRLGLVLCRHPAVGLGCLARSEGLAPKAAADHQELAALMRFVVSDEYARLYRSAWRPNTKRATAITSS